MKLIIKNKSHLKLYAQEMNYQTLLAFIKSEFPQEQDYSLTYQDSEGDQINVSSQIELDALVAQNEGKEFVKMILKQTTESSQEENVDLAKESTKNKRQKKEKSEKKPKKEKREKSEKKQKKTKKESSAQKLQKIEEQPIQISVKDPKIHSGIQCVQCKSLPIVGVRYNCIQCQINVCNKCEETFEHEHDLLKIKKHRDQKEMRKQFREMKKAGRMFLRQSMREHGFSSSSGCQSKQKCRKEKDPKKKEEMIFRRKCRRLSKFFQGKPQQYEQFVKAHSELEIPETIALYAKENNISMQEKFKERFHRKINKLSLFFNKAAENYEQFVKDHPEENFRGLIKLLKEQGLETYDGENFKNMMKKNREERIAARQQKKKTKLETKEAEQIKTEKPKKSSEKKKSPKKEKKLQGVEKINKGIIMRDKGKVISVMKDLFGEQDSKKYFQFVEKNFQLDQQRIIEKYIQQNFEQH